MFVGGEDAVEVGEVVDFGLEGCMGGGEGVVLGAEGWKGGKVLVDLGGGLVGEGGGEGSEEVLAFGVGWNWRGWGRVGGLIVGEGDIEGVREEVGRGLSLWLLGLL